MSIGSAHSYLFIVGDVWASASTSFWAPIRRIGRCHIWGIAVFLRPFDTPIPAVSTWRLSRRRGFAVSWVFLLRDGFLRTGIERGAFFGEHSSFYLEVVAKCIANEVQRVVVP